jgi:hypothetical protein
MSTTSNETETLAGGATPAPAGSPPGSQATADWRDALPADLRGAARNFRVPADAVKSARDLRQKLSTMVAIPGDASTPEEVAEFRKRTGVPDSPEGYALAPRESFPDGVDAAAARTMEADFLRAMHAAGAPPAAVQAALDWYWGAVDKAGGKSDAPSAAEAAKDADAALRKAWGRAYDDNLVLARRAINDYGGGELAAYLERNGLGDSVALANALADLGRYRAEDSLFAGGRAGAGGDDHDRLDAIMSRPGYWNDASAQREAREIHERLYGTESIAAKALG